MARKEHLAVILTLTLASLFWLCSSCRPALAAPTSPRKGGVAITFDDCLQADQGSFADILKTLDRLFVPAVFFVRSSGADWAHVSLALRKGHQIGNHTYSHPQPGFGAAGAALDELSDASIASEIDKAQGEILKHTGILPHLFRAPGLHQAGRVANIAASRGLLTIGADAPGNDGPGSSATPAAITANILQRVKRGGRIILLHTGPKGAAALPGIIKGVRAMGFDIVPLDHLLYARRTKAGGTQPELRLADIKFGAYPFRTSGGFCSPGRSESYRGVPLGLARLSRETGLKVDGCIVYIPLYPYQVKAYNQGRLPGFIPPGTLVNLRHFTQSGIRPCFSLEPMGGVDMVNRNPRLIQDIARELGKLGPCVLRFASECNLHDSPYYIDPHRPEELLKLKRAFQLVHRTFQVHAPNVRVTFSPFIPNYASPAIMESKLRNLAIYLPYVAGQVDLLSGTFYPSEPGALEGIRRYAKMVEGCGKPFGIDELGCKDEATFARFMEMLVAGEIGRPRYLNFYDRDVQKTDRHNPWFLKPSDRHLLMRLAVAQASPPPGPAPGRRQALRPPGRPMAKF